MDMLIIIDPGVHTAEIECCNWIEHSTDLPIEVHYPALKGWESLEHINLDCVQGVIILGSGASPNDPTLEWQFYLKKWVHDYLLLEKPLLGICYGHQLLAHMHGGEIHFLSDLDLETYPPEAKESGLRTLWFTPQELNQLSLFTNVSPDQITSYTQMDWVVSHREVVSSLPQGWSKVGMSSISHLGVEVMQHNQAPWWGVQAHIEAVDAFLTHNGVELDRVPSPYHGHLWLSAFIKRCESYPVKNAN